MRAQVVPQATAGTVLLAPAVTHLRAIAIEMHMALGDVAQCPVRKQRLQREEVGIEAPVLEDGGDASGIARRSQNGFGFSDIQRERLVDQHVLAGGQRCDRQRRVLFIGRGDHYGIHRRVVEHLLRRGTHVHVTERAQQRVSLRTDDAVQHQAGCVLDQRCVEDTAGEAVADQGQLQVGAHDRAPAVGKGRVNDAGSRAKAERLSLQIARFTAA